MKYRNVIKYDYKPKLRWHEPRRSKISARGWLGISITALAVALVVAIASGEIGKFTFRLPSSSGSPNPADEKPSTRSVPLQLPAPRVDDSQKTGPLRSEPMTARPTEQPALKSDKTVTNKAQSKPQIVSQSAEPHTNKGQWRQVTVWR